MRSAYRGRGLHRFVSTSAAVTAGLVALPIIAMSGSASATTVRTAATAATARTAATAVTPTVKATAGATTHLAGHSIPAPTRLLTPRPVAHITQAAPARIPHLDAKLQVAPASKSGAVRVEIHGDVGQTAAAVRQVGGTVLAQVSSTISAVVQKSRLAALAGAPGVTAVDQAEKALELDNDISQGVAESNASAWQADAKTNGGAGVTIGIVDAGYADLASEFAAGRIPTETVQPLTGGSGCTHDTSDPADPNQDAQDSTEHGTAVAEVVHQMAPAATLVLYCIEDRVGFAAAEQAIVQTLSTANPIKIVNSSLGFAADGTSETDPASFAANSVSGAAVDDAQAHGILWIQAAGNSGADHWSGNLGDVATSSYPQPIKFDSGDDTDAVLLPPGGGTQFDLTWDQWPTSSAPLRLEATGFECTGSADDPCSSGFQLSGGPITSTQISASNPVLAVPAPDQDLVNFTSGYQLWEIQVIETAPAPAVRYDLSYWDEVSNSLMSVVNPARAAAGSVAEPADATGALAVGAADVSAVAAGASLSAALESYSSQGPTSDGRIKPDITGYDCVTGSPALGEFVDPSTGQLDFCGTSAAAPGVAGAAALVLAADPALTGAGLRNYLQGEAGPTQNNQVGYGLQKLPMLGSGYAPLAAPLRVRDTRGGKSASLGPAGKVQAGHVIDFSVAGSAQGHANAVPAGATAVAINLTVTNPTASGFLAALPGDAYANGQAIAKPATSTLNTSVVDPTVASFAIVTISTARKIAIYNSGGTADVIVDVLGYFSPSSVGHYSALPAGGSIYRALDTRPSLMGNLTTRVVTIPAKYIPHGATAAVVNVTATQQSTNGYLTLSPTCASAGSTSTLNYLRTRPARANLTVVGLSGNSFCVKNSGGPAAAIIDLVGFFTPVATANYYPLSKPARDLDTRSTVGGHLGRLGGNVALTVRVGGVNGVPSTSIGVASSLVAVAPSASSYLEAYPAGAPRPNGSTLNFGPGQVVSNAATANPSSSGSVAIYNHGGSLNVVMDVSGYFQPSVPPIS